MAMKKRRLEPTQYLNVDFELFSKANLQPLVAAMDDKVLALYVGRLKFETLGGETGLVPVLVDGQTIIWDTLAITEYLYEVYPQIWRADRTDRESAHWCGPFEDECAYER